MSDQNKNRHPPAENDSFDNDNVDDDENDDDDTQEDDTGVSGSGSGSGHGGLSAEVVNDGDSGVQMLADSEDEAAAISDGSEDEDEEEDSDNLSASQQKSRARRAQQRARAKMEARILRDQTRFQTFLHEMNESAACAPTIQDFEDLPTISSTKAMRLVLKYHVQPNATNAPFVPLFFCPPGRSSLPVIVGQFLKSHYDLSTVADIHCPELIPAISHVHHTKPLSPIRIYGAPIEKTIVVKKHSKTEKPAKKMKDKKNNKIVNKQQKESEEDMTKENKQKEKVETEEKEKCSNEEGKKASENGHINAANSSSNGSTSLFCPRIFVFASDIALDSVAANYEGTVQTFYSHLYALLSRFCGRFGITHIIFLHSMQMPVNLNLTMQMMKSSDVTQKQLQNFIRKATEVVDDGQDAEDSDPASPGAQHKDKTAEDKTDESNGSTVAGIQPSGVSSAARDSDEKKTIGTAHHPAPTDNFKGKTQLHRSSRSDHLKADAVAGRDKKSENSEESDGATDPEEKQEEEAQRAFERKLFSSFLYLTNVPSDAIALNKLGGRLLSHALLSGAISVFMNSNWNAVHKHTANIANNADSVNGNVSEQVSVLVLSGYYNPLLSDLGVVFKLMSTINEFALQLEVQQALEERLTEGDFHATGTAACTDNVDVVQKKTSKTDFRLDVRALRRRAAQIAKKVQKALMKSVSETADHKPSSMYL